MSKPTEKLTSIAGLAAPLLIDNLDTDQIMPKQFLRTISKEGLDKGLLYDLRFDGDGQPRTDCILNQPGYEATRILIAGSNFGCGSSREHAVWGLQQFGIAAVIAPSYGEIFYGNALNNRLLPIMLEQAAIDALVAALAQAEQATLEIDLLALTIRAPDGSLTPFALAPRSRRMLVDGLDMVALTLQSLPQIEVFEQRHVAAQPWMRVL
ncbi:MULTISPECIES: 3-isopropylmalate dehydratase small subunit [unclassified Janthinobacterium]|uniref:3-isopropylmalate dehydratase small subunit n=1 Tax=unclassified Janthinobacterium TaxID=2610881 RepID=UPI001608C822|nr:MULTISPECIES: 3-isopropylmalate dehydratase small subunit [unclassified Janthinobacterium]MBB5368437.1 3-isopropylmalate/(R)-2-methylmalate dehydratase small subunit [Janthinobacterium sp. K2C7]MBB5382027.1 3-isopropylmalate/(R)-2-methylmalate dehydratase small subunit [Janthinobacterium sp. K2Li3]MBB5386819.1 3-isopropylmalate/(R)-2-methylmalate dehydratase small subunit [Janthinobacterium sp. K2E3]